MFLQIGIVILKIFYWGKTDVTDKLVSSFKQCQNANNYNFGPLPVIIRKVSFETLWFSVIYNWI